MSVFAGQKAPSAIRCIKTQPKPPAPAPTPEPCQKAPSAIRCIKTRSPRPIAPNNSLSQKAPSAIRCIKTLACSIPIDFLLTPGQKAPSAIRCIKTQNPRADPAQLVVGQKARLIGQVVLVFGLSFVATKPKGGGWTRCDLSSWLARSCWFYPGF